MTIDEGITKDNPSPPSPTIFITTTPITSPLSLIKGPPLFSPDYKVINQHTLSKIAYRDKKITFFSDNSDDDFQVSESEVLVSY